jgi:hypothetical protein
MNATASPKSRLTLLEPEVVSEHRSVYCPDYDDCLEIAVRAGWRSWSCESCPRAREVRAPRADEFAISAE